MKRIKYLDDIAHCKILLQITVFKINKDRSIEIDWNFLVAYFFLYQFY